MLEWIGLGIGGIALGWFLRGRIGADQPQTLQTNTIDLQRNVREAEDRYLEVLRREIGNMLINLDPDLMISSYEKGWKYQSEVVNAGKERISADLKSLTLKHRFFSEFDMLGTRHFVPYEEARSMSSDDDIVERYLDISKMILLGQLVEPAHQHARLFTEEEFDVLRKTVRRCKDRAFKDRIEEGVQRYYAFRRAIDRYGSKDAQDGFNPLEERDLAVFRLPSDGPENVLGLVFKGTDEFAAYATFHDDDGKIFKTYNRSDPTFKKRQGLDA